MAAVYPLFGLTGKSRRDSDQFARGWMQEAASCRPHAPFGAHVANLDGDPGNLVACVSRANAQEGADVAQFFRQTQAQAIDGLIADPAFDDMLRLEPGADFDARGLARL